MLKDATAKGLNIYIASGYRSYNYQVNVYNRYVKSDGAAVADTYSSRPGNSEHQTGLCFDLNTIEDSFQYTTATNTASVSASLKAKILLPDISMNHGIFVM